MNRTHLAGSAGSFRTADTRVIIHEIQQLNAMTSDQVKPGESLWVPRG